MLDILSTINGYFWGKLLVWLLLGSGVVLSLRLKFPQFRFFGYMWKVVLGSRKAEDGGITSFQALCTSAAAQVGTGGIAGVATAIYSGGPGAVFWLWMTGLVGMGTIFVEAILAQVYREKLEDGTYRGGPGYYITKGLGKHWLGIIFSICLIMAMPFVFNAVQSNSIAAGLRGAFNITNTSWVGVVLVILTGVVIFGGIRRIARVAELVVPIMAGLYILVALFIIITHISMIPAVFATIIKSAFGIEAVAGGILGKTVMEAFRYGVARGIFSNEAGMGSTPNAHATASVKHPARQGFSAMSAVFINTMLICTSSAAIVILTNATESGKTGIELTQYGANIALGGFGPLFLSLALFFFAWTSIIANYYYGESNLYFIFPKMSKTWLYLFRLLVLGMIMFGSMAKVPLVWEMADFANGIMTFINLITILLLSGIAAKCMNDYSRQLKQGIEDPVIDPEFLKELRKEK